MNRATSFLSVAALLAVTALSSCGGEPSADPNVGGGASRGFATRTLPSGSSIDVALATALSSKTSGVGDPWTGTTLNALSVDGHQLIPAGTPVAGTVRAVKPAVKGDRAMLDLGLNSFTVGGRQYRVHGTTEAVIAGSTRARNLGAIAGSAAGGALIGQAVTGTGKGALIGGIVGGGVATGVVAGSDGYQVELKPGTALTFSTNEAVAVRL